MSNYLASGEMLNRIFGTKHNDPEKLWLVTPEGIKPYEIKKDEINDKINEQPTTGR